MPHTFAQKKRLLEQPELSVLKQQHGTCHLYQPRCQNWKRRTEISTARWPWLQACICSAHSLPQSNWVNKNSINWNILEKFDKIWWNWDESSSKISARSCACLSWLKPLFINGFNTSVLAKYQVVYMLSSYLWHVFYMFWRPASILRKAKLRWSHQHDAGSGLVGIKLHRHIDLEKHRGIRPALGMPSCCPCTKHH